MSRSSSQGLAKRRERGHAVLEVSLMAPWILFLFTGAFDMGSYAYAMICTESAARVAAFYTSSTSAAAADATGACSYVLAEMNSLPNTRSLTTCDALPVKVAAASITGVDGSPASNVSVTYQSDQFVPIPGLMGKLTVTRTVQMRVKQ